MPIDEIKIELATNGYIVSFYDPNMDQYFKHIYTSFESLLVFFDNIGWKKPFSNG